MLTHPPICPTFRCLVDGRVDDTSSAFITPRPREDVLRFRIDVFRFAGDTRNLVRLYAVSIHNTYPEPGCPQGEVPSPSPAFPQIYITCHLKVTPADQGPDPQNKACSFNKARNT